RSLAYVKINFTPVQNIDVSLFCNLTQLQTIDLKYNKIYSVTASQFSGCTSSLLELLLANNRLKRIIPSVFAPFRRLEVIDLSHNMLESFVGRFQNTEISQLLISNNLLPQIDPCEWVLMPNMTSLFIEKNKLIGVPDCLHKFPNLYSINLENNLLSSVSLAAFAQLKVLQYLRLSWNPIVSLATVPLTLKNLPKLSVLKLSQSPIEQIAFESFCNLSALTSLNLKNNLIASLTFQASSATSQCYASLARVSLSSNKLKHVNMTVFAAMRALEIIDLEYNQIEVVAGRLSNPKITTVILSNNNLFTINMCEWNTMPLIKSFSLAVNSLSQIPQCLGRMRRVQFLNFNHNKLTRITIDSFVMLTELRSLHFTSNAIQTVVPASGVNRIPSSLRDVFLTNNLLTRESVANWLRKLDTLDLMYNKIHTLASTLQCLQQHNLVTLNLRNNQLRILNLELLPLIGLFEQVDLSHNKIELLVGRFSSDHLQTLIVSHNRLKVIDFCQWDAMPTLAKMSFEANELTRVPNCIHHLPNLSYVGFGSNKFTQVDMERFGELDNLTTLDFSANRISLITFREEKYPVRLSKLILSNN
ncbi:AGAP007829-PA, partial [Anopheles gambiae str. PEST]